MDRHSTFAASSARDGERSPGRWSAVWPWLVGVGVALVVLGPALAPGSIFAYDLSLPPDLPVPRGVWGLGPELPRRVPLLAVPAWLAPAVPSWVTGKAMMVAAIAVAFVGAFRLLRTRSVVLGVSAGLLYALSPFLLTRLAVGHLPIVAAVALVPWCFRRLLRPGEDVAATLLCCGALAFTGNYGGLVALAFVVAGLVSARGRRAGAVVGAYLVAQLVWVVPAVFVLGHGVQLDDAHAFATAAAGPIGWAGVAAGGGFWNADLQLGWSAPVMAGLGVLLVGLAVVGHPRLPPWRRPVAVLAALGAAITLASSVDADANPFFALTRNPIGANLRDSQRALPLLLLWLAPAATLGADRIADGLGAAPAGRRIVDALPAALAVLLAAPGLFGLGGHLQAASIPVDWQQVRDAVTAEPGTVVALPWHEYSRYDLGADQVIFNPWPSFLGGDVVICSDPERVTACGSPGSVGERADAREEVISPLVAASRAGAPMSDGLAGVGVRWVVMAHVDDWRTLTGVPADPGLEPVVRGEDVDLYRVRGWTGALVDDTGHAVPIDPVLEPYARADASGAATWNHAAGGGWRRGSAAVGDTADGRLRLPPGDGPVWYWPAVVVVVADGIWSAAMVVAAVSVSSRRRHRPPSAPPRPPAPRAAPR